MSSRSHRHQRNKSIFWMMAVALLVPLLDASFNLTLGTIGGYVFDENAYRTGRFLGALHFSSLYLCVMLRLWIGLSHRGGRIIAVALILLILLGALGFGVFVQFRESETFVLWGQSFEGFYLRQGANGVISMLPSVAFVMILTPVIIPARVLGRLGELFSKDISTGKHSFDEYLKFRRPSRKKQKAQHADSNADHSTDPNEIEHHPDVLLVEDDIACATMVLKFCRKLKLDCLHVESLDRAQEAFLEHPQHWRLLILDNFVRVGHSDDPNSPKTGAQWAQQLNQTHPRSERHFHIAILSGHTHLLKDLSREADIVLQKPWDPKELFHYLKSKDLV